MLREAHAAVSDGWSDWLTSQNCITTHVDSKGKKREVSTFTYFTDILQEFGVLDVDGDEDPVFYPLTKAANKHWNKVYCDQETTETAGFLGGMTSRSAPHIRRLATILCVIDRERAVDVKHLKAAEGIWDYTQRCAQFIFKGYSDRAIPHPHARQRERIHGNQAHRCPRPVHSATSAVNGSGRKLRGSSEMAT